MSEERRTALSRKKRLNEQQAMEAFKDAVRLELMKTHGVKHRSVRPAPLARPLLPLSGQIRSGRFLSEREVMEVFCTAGALEIIDETCHNAYWGFLILRRACSYQERLPLSEHSVRQAVEEERQHMQDKLGRFVDPASSVDDLSSGLAAYLVVEGVILLTGSLHVPSIQWNPIFCFR